MVEKERLELLVLVSQYLEEREKRGGKTTEAGKKELFRP
jgi:hypothetical protein